MQGGEQAAEARANLAIELCGCPEVYECVLSLMSKKQFTRSEKRGDAALLLSTDDDSKYEGEIGGSRTYEPSSTFFIDEHLEQDQDGKLMMDPDILRYLEDQRNLSAIGE